MDQLTAYKILGVEPGCSRDEIKEAYAALSKMYHPEDYPEKFQEIHEAYQTLNRASRRSYTYEPDTSNVFFETAQENKPVESFHFEDEELESETEFYDFEETLRRTREADARKLHEEILRALAEFKVLTTPACCKKVKLFKEYFKKSEHQNAFRSPEYIKDLSFLVDESNLKKEAYYEIVSYYHLLDKDRNKIIPEAQMLYDALNKKVDMKAKPATAAKWLPLAFLPSIIRAIRIPLRGSEMATGILVLVLFIWGCIWIYKKLHTRFSHVVSQIFTLLFANIVLFFIYAFDIWTPFVSDSQIILDFFVYVFLFSCGWVIALILFSIIRLLIRSIKKHKT